MTSNKYPITLIVAVLKSNYGIGNKGTLPWKLSKEMKYFKKVTTDAPDDLKNVVIMGRKTWESIPKKFKPLSDRINVILSRSYKNIIENDVIYASDIENSFKLLPNNINRVFLIGGGEIYNCYIDHCSNLLITEIESKKDEKLEMDTFLKIDFENWEKSNKEEIEKFTGINNIEEDIIEGDFVYNYTLWKKKVIE
ncbi:unnamed protein product [Candida verbasci]|uniref:Dihydrofolate reductase n=1 Tax=Candida verbasci TaxID=1227364 RepID=A0A9W4U1U3_9ASCO|nr:unnamed protein product [Candida verbasci]